MATKRWRPMITPTEAIHAPAHCRATRCLTAKSSWTESREVRIRLPTGGAANGESGLEVVVT
jgi:hypothetical protein